MSGKFIISFLFLVNAFGAAVAAIPSVPLVHGHRGTRGTRPENTLPAFREAVAVGADVLEMDLQLSSDDVIIISHDPEIEGRLCRSPDGKPMTVPIPIHKLTAREISTYDCGVVANPKFPDQLRVPHTPKPTLENVLAWAKSASPTVQFNIETKMTAPSPDLVADPKHFVVQILKVLRKYDLVNRTILQSFDPRTLLVAKKMEPRLRLSYLFEEEKNYCSLAAQIGATIASPAYQIVNAGNIADCHARGIEVHPWTPNSEMDWQRLVAEGVDGIITDFPRKLIAFLAARSKRNGG